MKTALSDVAKRSYQSHESRRRDRYRFAREVSALAPKPGHHLGTMSIALDGGRAAQLNIIEGAANDAVTLSGIITDFRRTTIVLFNIAGTLNVLDSFPYNPHAYGMQLEFADGSMLIGTDDVGFAVTDAQIIYSRTRSATGPDPDGALIRIEHDTGPPLMASFSGFKEGWIPVLVGGVVVLVGYGLYKLADKALDKMGDALDHVKIKATIKAGPVEGGVEAEFGKGASTK